MRLYRITHKETGETWIIEASREAAALRRIMPKREMFTVEVCGVRGIWLQTRAQRRVNVKNATEDIEDFIEKTTKEVSP